MMVGPRRTTSSAPGHHPDKEGDDHAKGYPWIDAAVLEGWL